MDQPDVLSLELHLEQIEAYGGAPGVRDIGLLESAIAQPRAAFGGAPVHADLFEMAAAYLFHIVRNHPFVDGNKRTALFAALVFLEIHGVEMRADPDDLAELVLRAAERSEGKSGIAAFLRNAATGGPEGRAT